MIDAIRLDILEKIKGLAWELNYSNKGYHDEHEHEKKSARKTER